MQQQKKLPNSLAVWPIACVSGERCHPMAVRLLPPDSAAVLSDPSGSARSLHSSFSGSPLPTSRLVSLSLLSPSFLVCRISVRALVETRETPGVEGSALPAATSTPHGFWNIRWPSSLTHQRTTPELFWAKREGTLKSLLKKIAGGKIARHKAVMG